MASKSNRRSRRATSKKSRTAKGSRQKPETVESQTISSPGSPESTTPMPIPEVVSRRMIRRIILFSGFPTLLGLGSFGINYVLLTQGVWQLPPYVTLVESFSLFGLGFLGISYGVLSSSWEPEPGTRLGWQEFRLNLGRVIQQWRERQGDS